MKTAVLFGTSNTLDFQDVRISLCRIPEVSLRIEEAQKIWDKTQAGQLSFHHFMMADNTTFFNNINVKSLLHAIIQVGLFDRLKRRSTAPDIIIGNIKSDSSLLVCAGVITLEEMILKSRAVTLLKPLVPLQIVTDNDGLLGGQSLPLYGIFQKSKTTDGRIIFQSNGIERNSIPQILDHVIEEHSVRELISVGPGSTIRREDLSISAQEIRTVDSIEIDPMLSWFWGGIRRGEVVTAI